MADLILGAGFSKVQKDVGFLAKAVVAKKLGKSKIKAPVKSPRPKGLKPRAGRKTAGHWGLLPENPDASLQA